MWCNPWLLKNILGAGIKMLCVGGGIYWSLYAFAKITYKLHIKKINKNK